MAKKHTPVAEVPALPPVVVEEIPTLADLPFDIDDAEVEADIVKRNSVVKAKYKVRYAQRAVEAGLKKKRAKRSAPASPKTLTRRRSRHRPSLGIRPHQRMRHRRPPRNRPLAQRNPARIAVPAPPKSTQRSPT